LFNASPDLRQQIEASPFLHPHDGLRSSPIAGIVLTGGDVDAIAGLLTLRERQKLAVFATRQVLGILASNTIFDVLAPELVARRAVALDVPTPLALPDGRPSGLAIELFAVPGKVPLYLEAGDDPAAVIEDGATVGVRISDATSTVFFIPGCARMTERLAERLRGADTVLFDGTLFADDEMIQAGLGTKTGRRMGHMSVTGADGTIAAFAALGVRRRVLIHINNSNPILLDDSPEHASVEAAGWEVAYDGMEIRP
jgi:pyrroloquinoline quinone biosynthesis protein B